MNTRMAAVLLVALMGATGSLSGCAAQPPLEDETGWNCLIDGNGHCGRTIHTGKVLLVAKSDPWGCDFDGSDDEDTCD